MADVGHAGHGHDGDGRCLTLRGGRLVTTGDTVPAITPADAGCWLDGAQGWHNTYRVVYRAEAYGMTLTDDDRLVLDAYQDRAAAVALASGEALNYGSIAAWAESMADSATDHLQSLAPEGYVFDWDDGLYLRAAGEADQ